MRLRLTGLEKCLDTIPKTAVFVANWQEEDVLGKMVEGNLARIQSPEVSFFLGVYPNDTGTVRVAKELEAKHPDRVRVIINTLPGPTSKGQMLNEMFSQVFSSDDCPEMAVLHDSEDIIDPRTFQIYAAYAREYDYVQVPVFSLNRGKGAHVASTYMDEFAERHSREMIVRDAVGASIPSAGVGTCMTKRLLKHFLRTRGQVLMSGTVTEDYILGVEAKREGFNVRSPRFQPMQTKDSTSWPLASSSPRRLQPRLSKRPAGFTASISKRCAGLAGRVVRGISISLSATARA